MGYLAKTDRIDAQALAQLAQVLSRHPERERFITALPSPEQQALQALVARRRQLVAMYVAEHQRLSCSHAAARKSIEPRLFSLGGAAHLRGPWRTVGGHFGRCFGVHGTGHGLLSRNQTATPAASPSSRVLMNNLG